MKKDKKTLFGFSLCVGGEVMRKAKVLLMQHVKSTRMRSQPTHTTHTTHLRD